MRACIELALLLRLLDDKEGVSHYLKQTNETSFGILILPDNSSRQLDLRDVANKIIHASELQWDLSREDRPLLVCSGSSKEKWDRAEIDVMAVASLCGGLMS